MKILCKILGHKISELNTKRKFAQCDRCDKGLKVSYDMSYGETIVVGDYGKQITFCWCDCGNELCSSNSHKFCRVANYGQGIKEIEFYKCSNCGKESKWDFDTPSPVEIKD